MRVPVQTPSCPPEAGVCRIPPGGAYSIPRTATDLTRPDSWSSLAQLQCEPPAPRQTSSPGPQQ